MFSKEWIQETSLRIKNSSTRSRAIALIAAIVVIAIIAVLVPVLSRAGDADESGSSVTSAVEEPAEESPRPEAIDPNQDSDDDGIPDVAEIEGWQTKRGETYRTDPRKADTDGDGLKDGVEAGEDFEGISNPLEKDSDNDGLDDLNELDSDTDPFRSDSDGDGLNDGKEVLELNTDPLSKDTDGDGLNDDFELTNRDDQGLDPIFFDEKTETKGAATEFARGFFLGEFSEGDSIAWLSGALVAEGVAIVPSVGLIFGTIAGFRDAIASAIHKDWVSLGLNLSGLIPGFGDATGASGKVHKFLKRYPDKIDPVLSMVAKHARIPTRVKVEIHRSILGKKWDYLVAKGANKEALVQMQGRRVSLERLHAAMQGKHHVVGRPVDRMDSWKAGEDWLQEFYGKRARHGSSQLAFPTKGCLRVCNPVIRRFDLVADGVAHESKVGYHPLSERMKRQIESDAFAVAQNGDIKAAHWHFFPDKNGRVGADPEIIDLLNRKGIPNTIHLPKN